MLRRRKKKGDGKYLPKEVSLKKPRAEGASAPITAKSPHARGAGQTCDKAQDLEDCGGRYLVSRGEVRGGHD